MSPRSSGTLSGRQPLNWAILPSGTEHAAVSESAPEILKCDYSNEIFRTVLSSCAVHYPVQSGYNVLSLRMKPSMLQCEQYNERY